MAESLDGARTIWELIDRRARLTPEATVLIDASDRRITFGEYRDLAERRAAGLHALGVGDGTPVTWQLPSTIDTVVLVGALARLGALQNPILHIYRERELAVALRGMGSELLVTPSTWRGHDYAAMARSVLGGLDKPPRLLLVDDVPEGDVATLPPPPGAGAGEDPVRWVYYTSGTTSEPKGVLHTDGTLLAGGIGLARALDRSPDDLGSIAFPFAHIAGPDYFVMMLVTGFGSVIVDAFVPAEAVEVYRRNHVTMAGGSTAFYQAFLNEQRKDPDTLILPDLKVLAGGGAAKPAEIFHECLRELGVRIAHGYGMTEVPMITEGSPNDTDEQLINTEGAPVVGAEVRIVTDEGAVAAPGQDGEVRVKGPMVCKGYTDPAVTAEAFDADGYFKTGDLGHLRPDGHLVLTGRLKDVIIRKGENISAREVEELLFQHPKVHDVAVIGLPDRERGERVCAVVEREPGLDDLTFAEMGDFLRSSGLMVQKLPEQLEVVDALPRNEALRKVLKYQLRDELAGKAWPT